MRSIVLRLITRLPYGVRLRLIGAPAPVAGAVKKVWRWAGTAPLAIASGPARGLSLDAGFDFDHVQAGEMAAGTVEPEVQRALADHLRPGGVLFDVGANVGFLSVLGARLVGAHGAVHAFEPVAENAAAIRRSAALNRFDHLVVHQRAVTATGGARTLLMDTDGSWARLDDPASRQGAVAERTVETVVLDTIVGDGRTPAPSMIKIDVEGGEEEVVRGLAATIDRHRPVIVVELHPPHGDGVPALLESHGYRVRALGGASLDRRDAPVQALALPPA